MSFGDYLYKEFLTESGGLTKFNEVALFTALNSAFEKAAKLYGVSCSIIHHKRSFVDFEEIPGKPFFCDRDRGKRKMCELADLLIVALNQSEMRVCCLQNKIEDATARSSVDRDFVADTRQFYLLNQRPEFQRNGRTSQLLRNATFASIASYGVFYKDDSGYNMNYSSAEILKRNYENATGRKVKVKRIPGTAKRVTKAAKDEIRCVDNVLEFGKELENMLIGESFNYHRGLLELKDIDILDAVAEKRIVDELERMREDMAENGPGVAYRSAVVIDFG